MLDLTPLEPRAADILARARARRLKIVTAESCTGGLVAGLLTAIAGSSDVFERGYVTYSYEAKTELLGVDAALLKRRGAVDREVAETMAAGALARSHADVAVSVTGIAGPGGGTAKKPVGLVHFAVARGARIEAVERRFGDLGRDGVRRAAVIEALDLLDRAIAWE